MKELMKEWKKERINESYIYRNKNIHWDENGSLVRGGESLFCDIFSGQVFI